MTGPAKHQNPLFTQNPLLDVNIHIEFEVKMVVYYRCVYEFGAEY